MLGLDRCVFIATNISSCSTPYKYFHANKIKSFVKNQPKTHTAFSITYFSIVLYSYPGNKEQTAALAAKESSLNIKASISGSACLVFEFDFEFVTN